MCGSLNSLNRVMLTSHLNGPVFLCCLATFVCKTLLKLDVICDMECQRTTGRRLATRPGLLRSTFHVF